MPNVAAEDEASPSIGIRTSDWSAGQLPRSVRKRTRLPPAAGGDSTGDPPARQPNELATAWSTSSMRFPVAESMRAISTPWPSLWTT